MEKEPSVTCPECKRNVSITDIILYNKKRICGYCYDKVKGRKMLLPDNEVKPKERHKKSELSYICNACNYKFSRPEGFDRSHVCPFCGARGTIQRETTSQDIIYSVSRDTEILE